jgi:PDZ domain-containing protein
MLRRVAILGAAVLAVVAVGLALSFISSDHYIVLPDRARPTDPLVRIPGEEPGSGESGIYMVDVRVGRATLLERIYPGIHEGASLLPERVVNPSGVSDTQRRRSSLNDMSRSQLVAITVALRELDEEVEVDEAGAEVVLVQPDAPAEDELEVGDVIVEADGDEVDSTAALQRAMSDVEPGERVTLAVERPEEGRVEVTLPTRAAADDADRAVVGVQVQNALDFDFPVDIEIDAGAIGGPSAGLAFALDIVDELGEGLTNERTVVATGELTLDGEVLPIGGIKQKTIGARRAGADVFLVPDANAAEAREAADGLEIVAVSNFQEALSALATR